MVKSKLPVRWDPVAKQLLDEIYDYIAVDSVDAGRHVKKSLVQLGNSLGHFPEKYSREEYLGDITGNYCSVSRWLAQGKI